MKTFSLFLFIPLTVLAASDPLTSARSALDAGFPQVAIQKITEAYPKIRSGREIPAATLLLARALCDADRPSEAEKLLSLPGVAGGEDKKFWQAQALAAQGRWDAALPLYLASAESADTDLARRATIGAARMESNLERPAKAAKLLAPAADWPPGPLRSAALLDLAETNLSLGDPAAAKEALDAMGEPDSAFRQRTKFLRAQSMLASGDDAGAVQALSDLRPINDSMALSAVVDHAAALARLNRALDAENLLEEFIEAHRNISGIDTIFAALDGLYLRSPTTSSAELKRWSEDRTDGERKSFALFYRAMAEKRQGHTDTALELLGKFLSTAPESPLRARAVIEIASLELEAGRPKAALATLPPEKTDPEADFVRGLALSVMQDPASAADAFRLAAIDPRLAETSLFNAAVSEILAGKKTKPSWVALKDQFPKSTRLSRLDLIEALELARTGAPDAETRLAALASQGDPSINAEAGLALAEWNFLNGNSSGARLALQKISTSADPARKAALSVFLTEAEDPYSPEAAIDAASRYLKDYPESEAEPEIRMKLAELLYKKGDFGGARMQFEALARKFPGTRFEEPALFLAGQSASRLLDPSATNDAMLLFEEVAAMNQSFALRARFEQAVLQNSLDRPDEALVILDRILASQPDATTRASALMEKGKTQFLAGNNDMTATQAAITTWQLIAQDPDADPVWKNQALARIGIAQEKLGLTDAALASFYEVIEPGNAPRQEFFWFYKAGFDAGRLLESAKRWEEAVRVYEILASSKGSRATEASERINKIRLENFLWDGD